LSRSGAPGLTLGPSDSTERRSLPCAAPLPALPALRPLPASPVLPHVAVAAARHRQRSQSVPRQAYCSDLAVHAQVCRLSSSDGRRLLCS
jgi:hypothetical protein